MTLTPLIAVLVACLANGAYAADPADERRPLFNGTDLSGWQARPHIDPREIDAMSDQERQEKLDAWMEEAKQHWTVEDQTLICDGEGPYLATEEDFADFDLTLEYAISPAADSGVYLRGSPQVQIWDPANPAQHDHGNKKGSGGLWNNPEGWPGKDPLVKADKPIGEFNTMRIVMIGSRVTVWLNDELVVDHALMDNYFDRGKPMFREGPIVLQTHGGETRWRNLTIREIDDEEADHILRAGGPAHLETDDDDGFISLFNGENLDGWAGSTGQFRVEEGAVIGSPGADTIYTNEEYGDFVVRCDFRLSEQGNNGLAIRYPGEGDPAYAGMCELQVLDNTAYPDLKPQQIHGSPYGMAAAIDGFQRPVGEWNYQETTVKGHGLRVELNGNVILDCDVSDESTLEPMFPLETFEGRLRTRGHFGLAGHKTDVAFRNIDIKPLD